MKRKRKTGHKEGNMSDPNAVKSMYKQEGKMDLTAREVKTNQKGVLVGELKQKPVGTLSVYCEKWKFEYLLKNGKDISMLENNFKVVLEMKNNDTLDIYGSNSSTIRDVEVELKKMIVSLVKLTPSSDMLYVWRFAFTSPVVSRKMDKALKEFDAVGELNEDCVIVQIDCHKPVQSTDALLQAISTACKDICKASFRFNLKAREDIEQEIDFLKEKKTTLLRPVNPFKSKEADIYMVNISESEGIVVLVTLDRFFKMCQDDVSEIIKKCEALSSDIPKVSSYVSAEGYTQHKEFDAESHKPITHVRNKDGECMPKPIREDKENYQLLGQISVNMNCEKWKYDCLRKIDGGLAEIEQKYDVRVSLKDDTTLCIEGKSKDTLTQMTGVIRKLMKGLVRKIRPVDVVDHEKLEADQDYKQRIEAFEKKYSIAMELGHVLDYEENFETSFDDLNVILSKTTEQTPQLVQIDLQFSDQGFVFIIGGRMFMEKKLDGVIRCAMKQSINHTMALLLDDYGDQGPKATQIVSVFVSCLKDTKKERGSVYTLYVCTHTAGQWFDLKDMLSRYTLSTFTPLSTYRTDKQMKRIRSKDELIKIVSYISGQSIGIEIVSGELAKQKVDVLVNSSNENFTLDQGAVSLSLLKAAGKGMQDEINNKNKKNLKASQLLETKGYRLKSKHVLHSYLYCWNFHSQEKQEVCKKSLQKFVYNCLRRTQELGCKSMAFPALGAGVLKYPLETVATEMIATIHQYNRENPGSCIENVLIVIYTADRHIFQVFKRIQQELNEKQNEKALPYKVLEECVVLAGRKENVAGANDHLMSELLSADTPRMDISGRFKTNYDATRNTQGNNKRFRVENEDNLPLTPANDAGANLCNSRNKATVSKDDTANSPGQEQRYGFKTRIKGRLAELSNPYGSASNDTAPRDIDSSPVADDVWQVKSPGVIHTPKGKPRKQKIQMGDSESIEILDKPGMEISGRIRSNSNARRNAWINDGALLDGKENNLSLTSTIANDRGIDIDNTRNKATVSKDEHVNESEQEPDKSDAGIWRNVNTETKVGNPNYDLSLDNTRGIEGHVAERDAEVSDTYASKKDGLERDYTRSDRKTHDYVADQKTVKDILNSPKLHYGFKTSLTQDKGAIPKTKGMKGRPSDLSNPYGSALDDTAPRDIDSSQVSDDVRQVKSPGAIQTLKQRPRKQKIQMVDAERFEILDQPLVWQITVSLNKTIMRKFRLAELDALKKILKENNNVKLDLNSLTLQGKAKHLVSAVEELRKFINITQTSDSTMSQRDEEDDDDNDDDNDDDDDGDDDDDDDAGDDDDDDDLDNNASAYDDDDDEESYEVDPDLEETYFQRALSRVDNMTSQGRQIKNVRKEVFVFWKVYYKREWMKKFQGCQVDFDDGEITIQSAEDVSLAEVSNFIKSGIDKLDKFYFCDIASNKTVEEIMKACNHVKGDSNTFDNVYVYEDDGVVRLSGSLFEQVDEFSKIVRTKLAGVQPRSRANRELDMVSDEVFSPSLRFETSLVGPSHDKVSRGFDPEMQKGCRSFYTDEGLKVFAYKADILKLHVDGIVNAANSELKHRGGIAKVIAKAAGPSFKKESEDYIARHKRLYVGESCVTTAGGLSYKCVIHTVGPCMSDYGKDHADDVNADLYKAIYSSLEEARKAQLKSVGIPPVSSGVFGVPQRWCSMQYCLAVKNFGKRNSNCCLKEIHFIDTDDDMLNIIGLTCDVVFNGSEKAKKELGEW